MHPRHSDAIRGQDGTRIAFHLHTTQPALLRARRPMVVLSNGLATPEHFLRHVIARLAPYCHVVHWHYRGHGESEAAHSNDYSLETMADDLARVTEAAMRAHDTVDPPIHLGFSMGVPIGLELYRARPDLVQALICVAGPAGAPLMQSFPFTLPFARTLTRTVVDALTPFTVLVRPFVKLFLLWPPLPYTLSVLTRTVAKHTPREDIEHFIESFRAMDFAVFWQGVRALLRAKGESVLPSVRVPVLLVEGGHDTFVPEPQRKQLRKGLPHAETLHLPRGTHALLVEEGPLVANTIASFLTRVVPGLDMGEQHPPR